MDGVDLWSCIGHFSILCRSGLLVFLMASQSRRRAMDADFSLGLCHVVQKLQFCTSVYSVLLLHLLQILLSRRDIPLHIPLHFLRLVV